MTDTNLRAALTAAQNLQKRCLDLGRGSVELGEATKVLTALLAAAEQEERVRGVVDKLRELAALLRHEGLSVLATRVDRCADALSPQPAESVTHIQIAGPNGACPCGLSTCVEPWEEGCGLGKSEDHVRVAAEPPASAVAGGVDEREEAALVRSRLLARLDGIANDKAADQHARAVCGEAARALRQAQPEGVAFYDTVKDIQRRMVAATVSYTAEGRGLNTPAAAHLKPFISELGSALALYTRPAEVSDEMVDKALAALIEERGTYEGEVPITRDDARAALAALVKPS